MSRFFSEKYDRLIPYTPGEQPQGRKYIKLNTNESPFPPSPRARQLAKEAAETLLANDPDLTTCPATAERIAELFTQAQDTLN